MGSGFARARTGAAIVGASATALLLTALPASAGQSSGDIPTNGSGQVKAEVGYTVPTEARGKIPAKLMDLNLDDDSSLQAYCVELEESVDPSQQMIEEDWDEYPNSDTSFNENRDKIHWILQNSYPEVGRKQLATDVADDGAELKHGDKIRKKVAITATQAAIWHFSDDVELDEGDHTTPDGEALYEYLIGENNTGIDEPEASLHIDTDEATGHAGDLVGPVSISTSGEITDVDLDLPDGVDPADADGDKLDTDDLTNGDEFYLDVPKDAEAGEAEISAEAAKTEVDVGRLFVAENYAKKPAQSLIAASTGSANASTSGTVSWETATEETTPPKTSESETPSTSETESESAAPAPTSENNKASEQETEDLAYTGASVITPVAVGVGLLAVGGIALFLVRRRQKA